MSAHDSHHRDIPAIESDQKQRQLETWAAFLAFTAATGEKPADPKDRQLAEIATGYLHAAFLVLKEDIHDPRKVPALLHDCHLHLPHQRFIAESIADLPALDSQELLAEGTPELLASMIGAQARSCLGAHQVSIRTSVQEFETELGLLHFYPFLRDDPVLLRAARNALIAFSTASALLTYDGSANHLFQELHTILQAQAVQACTGNAQERAPIARILDIEDEITRKWL